MAEQGQGRGRGRGQVQGRRREPQPRPQAPAQAQPRLLGAWAARAQREPQQDQDQPQGQAGGQALQAPGPEQQPPRTPSPEPVVAQAPPRLLGAWAARAQREPQQDQDQHAPGPEQQPPRTPSPEPVVAQAPPRLLGAWAARAQREPLQDQDQPQGQAGDQALQAPDPEQQPPRTPSPEPAVAQGEREPQGQESPPYRHQRAHSFGGSSYDAFNSEHNPNVRRIDAGTGARTTITGGAIAWAVNQGGRSGHPAAQLLVDQEAQHLTDRRLEDHHPMGCAEARAEAAIAAHHMSDVGSPPDRGRVRDAWDHAGQSTYAPVVNQRADHVPACNYCSERGH